MSDISVLLGQPRYVGVRGWANFFSRPGRRKPIGGVGLGGLRPGWLVLKAMEFQVWMHKQY